MHLEHQSLKSIFCPYTKHLSEDSRRPQYADLLNLCHSSSLIYFLDVFYHPFLSVLVLLLLLLLLSFTVIKTESSLWQRTTSRGLVVLSCLRSLYLTLVWVIPCLILFYGPLLLPRGILSVAALVSWLRQSPVTISSVSSGWLTLFQGANNHRHNSDFLTLPDHFLSSPAWLLDWLLLLLLLLLLLFRIVNIGTRAPFINFSVYKVMQRPQTEGTFRRTLAVVNSTDFCNVETSTFIPRLSRWRHRFLVEPRAPITTRTTSNSVPMFHTRAISILLVPTVRSPYFLLRHQWR